MFATDPQVIPEDKKYIGMVIIIVMVTNIIFAVGIMMNDSIRETVRQCKMKKKRSLAIKMMKERKAAAQAAIRERPLNPIQEESQVVEAKFNTLKLKGRDKGKANNKGKLVQNKAKPQPMSARQRLTLQLI